MASACATGPASPGRRRKNPESPPRLKGEPARAAWFWGADWASRDLGGEKSESPLSSGKVLSSAAQGRAEGHCGALLLHSIELRPHEACSRPLASK